MNQVSSFLNSLAVGAEAAESTGTYAAHPLGSFRGKVQGIEHKVVNERPIWEVQVKTNFGVCAHSCWGFSDQDLSDAQTNDETRDRMINAIKRYKRLMVDCSVWSHEQAAGMSWDDLMKSWIKLVGQDCQVVVKDNPKKTNQQLVYVNYLPDNFVDSPEKTAQKMPEMRTFDRKPQETPPSFGGGHLGGNPLKSTARDRVAQTQQFQAGSGFDPRDTSW